MTARPVMATDVAEAASRLSEGSKGKPFTSTTIVVELRQNNVCYTDACVMSAHGTPMCELYISATK